MDDKVIKLREDRKNFLAELKAEASKKDERKTSPTLLFEAFLVSCLGTTLPYPGLNYLFGVLTAVTFIALVMTLVAYRKQIPTRRISLIAAGIVVSLSLSGCSGLAALWTQEPVPVVVLNEMREYKTSEVSGYGLFGFGVQDITPETAMKKGNLTKAYATQESRSYGWISVAKATVYGE